MKIVAKNRRATFDYAIEEKLIAGLVLTGTEVKAAKGGHIQLKGSFVKLDEQGAWVLNSHISHYKHGGPKQHDTDRNRKLLVTKKQLDQLRADKQRGKYIVPLAVGIDHGLLKLEIGIGASTKRTDKRQKIKKRESDIEAERAAKNYS